MLARDPSNVPLLLKLSALTWTARPEKLHVLSICCRASLVDKGRPAPGDTQERVNQLLKRAVTEIPWPELPGGVKRMFEVQMLALHFMARLGEPEAAVEILSRHVEDIESEVGASFLGLGYIAKYYIYRLDWLLSAAVKFEGDEEKRGAYVAEAKGLVGRAIPTLAVRALARQNRTCFCVAIKVRASAWLMRPL
jgi:hypothetical protein